MANNKLLFYLSIMAFTVSSILLSGCGNRGKVKSCTSVELTGVGQIDGAKTGLVNKVIPLTVYWSFYNGCGTFDHFSETKNGYTLTIDTYAAYNTCSVCAQDAGYNKTTYNFTTTNSGIYYLKFYVPSSNSFVVDTLTIN